MSTEQNKSFRSFPASASPGSSNPGSSNTTSSNTQASSYAPRPPSSDGSSCRSADHLEQHRRKIAEAAYLMAEKRGFRGDAFQDWLEAERAVCGKAEMEMDRR